MPNNELPEQTDSDFLRLTQTCYDVPSLAAWRAAELKVLKKCTFAPPILELGCGSGRFTTLFLDHVDWGVDSNPKEVKLCEKQNKVYRRVGCMDARRLHFADSVFGTVLANCVVEHIPDLAKVLRECRRVLKPSGVMVATVPLQDMNRHLWLDSPRYARWRAKRLQHEHLLTEDEWRTAFLSAGFDRVQTTPYLSARMCELWDRVDGPLSLGSRRVTLGRVYSFGVRLLPSSLRSGVNYQWHNYFVEALQQNPPLPACAILIEAQTPEEQAGGIPQPTT